MSNRRIVVSIDFGTTYSGVAWADTTRPDVQHVLTEWPSAGSSKSSPKVPTELRRVANGWQWGFQIPESAKRIRYFKLKLDDPAQITKEGESAKDLTKVYLSCLHEHFVSLLEKRLSPSVVKSTPMDFVVTVPAIWSPKAKQSTEQAAAMAGFCGNQRIQLISEPEAAALYTLKTLSPSTLQVGRKFVVCDAGGGTVDLISYQVTKIGRVEVKEVTEGTGGKCGSSMLNMRFRRHLKQTHGDKYWTDERLIIALSEFESFKKTFSPKGEPLTLKVDPSLGLRRNRYTMTQDDMKTKIFEPIMKDVVCLIKEQIKMAGDGVAAVIMVGGFGQSRYLKSRVRDAISSRTDVLQPESGWTAVVKGAAMHGLSRYQPAGTRVEVASRIARRSYGTCLMTKYDMMKHNPREAFWSEKEQETVVSEMCWFIQKGESYPEGKPSRIEYQCDLPVMLGHVPQTEIDIYSNNNDGKAPVHLDETTQHIGTLSLDLRKIPEAVKRTAKIRRMGWHRYYCLKGAIEAVYGSAEITYTVKLGASAIDANLDSSLKQQDTAAPNDAACIMAANLHLRAAVPDHGQPAGKVVAGPPPSTLAAQLVENISASTKSSKSDENSELKGFFAIIQRVKDDPTLLKTPEDRVEHNHMLIYVYSRAVLEGIRLDDPFLDRTQVRTEGLKAISFLRFSIKETPEVLKHRVGEQEYMFRGREPLWVWLLPQLLRLLGHSQCLELTEAIEGFLQYTMLIIAQNWTLWDMAPSFLFYLRTITSHILQQLQDPLLVPSVEESFKTLSLPPQIALSQFVEKESPFTSQLTYSVDRMSQALHQLISFCKVVAYPLTASDDAFDNVTSFSESVVWLIDVLGDMRVIQTRYGSNFPASSLYVLQLAQEIERALLRRKGISASVHKKAITLMVLLCGEIATSLNPMSMLDIDEETRHTYCMALAIITAASTENTSICRLAVSGIVDESSMFYTSLPEGTDLPKLLSSNLHPLSFEDSAVQEIIETLALNYEPPDTGSQDRPKRRKLIQTDSSPMAVLMRRLGDVIGVVDVDDDFLDLENQILGAFPKTDISRQCLMLDLLSRISCAADGGNETMNDAKAAVTETVCSICEHNAPPVRSNLQGAIVHKSRIEALFTKLIRLPALAESRRPRVAAMLAIRRVILHCEDTELLNLETSGIGQWCLQSLNSSVRELRVAAGRVLATFSLARPEHILSSMVLPARPAEANGVGNPPVNQAQATFTDGNFLPNVSNGSSPMKTQDLISRNRKNSIAFLKSISDKNQPNLTETFIMAWGQLGTVVWEHELNLVLIKLLEYLGSNNNIVSACAFNELLNLADARRVTPRRLFEPFWPNLAYMTTKDMVQRPQMSRTIAELLQVSVNELLLLIQTHALPWLVLDKQKDVIQKIAEARQESEVWLPLIDPANLAATLALLLVQDTDDIASFAKSRLEELSTHFQTEPLVNLLQVEPVLTVIELLKAAGDADETKKAPVRKALDTMAKMMIPANKETRAKKSDHTARFIHSQLLGLMACLFDVINDQSLPDPERRRYIRAMEEMIRVSRGYASTARPQMSACLLSTLAQDALREASFSCWASMLTHLEETDVEALLETTFFVVTRYWPFMNESTALLAQQMLKSLVDEFDHLVAKYIVKLPSLRHIPELRDIETKMDQHRPAILAVEEVLEAFAERICHENSGVALQALTELIPYLQENQAALHTSEISLQSDIGVVALMRSLLDCASKYSGFPGDIARLCTEAMGLIGCLDPSKIETVREQRSIVILNNFATNEETTDFVLFLLEEALVPAFLSTTDVKFQGFLSFAMQELMGRCDIKAACAMENSGMKGGNDIYRKWIAMPETVREVVAPFLASRPYPSWLRVYVLDLLRKGQTPFADLIFEPLARVIRVKDLSIAEFILPYIVLHTLLGSRTTQQERDDILGELLAILQYQPAETASYQEKEDMRRYCHLVFGVVDYAMRWMQTRRAAGRLTETDRERLAQVQDALDLIPAELIAQRAVDCNEYARALFHLEQHAHKMEQRKKEPGERTRLLQKLQDIYANVDEPDGLDGISAHLQVLDINQQILSHRKAGRWTAVQNWYEMQLAENPDNTDIQIDLLHCLKQAGQHEGLLNHIEGMHTDASTDNKIMPYAVEAAWVTGRWESLTKFAQRFRGDPIEDFNISIATLFEKLRAKDKPEELIKIMKDIRVKISSSMNAASTSSLQACHDLLLKSHVLTDVEIIIGTKAGDEIARQTTAALLERRLEIIGAYMNDKQYLLGIRRATMELTRPTFTDLDISGLWLSSARLARKSNSLHQSFNAILHASKLGDDAATIENAKLLWREDQHRKAIQVLQGAIKSNKFMTQTGTANSTSSSKLSPQQKLLTARAQLLLAKWLDSAGQTHAGALREKYQQPPKTFSTWEKGHYYLGRHYKKILEAEKPLKADDQSDNYITGEVARLVIENYVRSLNSGTKYLYQTLPRILTLWLDLGAQVDKAPEGKASLSRELHRRRVEQLNLLHSFLDKYIHRLPAYIFYTALPQIVARIAHPNSSVFDRLTHIIAKVVEAHPRQALWSLIGIMTTRQVSERKARGTQILQTLRNISKKVEGSTTDFKHLLRMGEKLAEQLLLACQNGDFRGNKTVHASLGKDLRFNHKCTPCPLVVPVESSLTATLPAVSEYVKKHKAFSRDVVTIDSFLDDVLVLSSLAKPRRLTTRGSDGKSYMLLIKPKDDLRTDQRLMEFNGLINRSLKRDAESSRRQLYIRTYAVTPLNEECGIIEWVPGIKTMRDILINLYASRKIYPDYTVLKQLMDEACLSDGKTRIFTDEVLGRFPPVLQLWFTQQFPSPSTWFAARLKYTRSCAVMSMVGTILGLGDRHGENVNLEEGNGGVFHVDFNCLFDKGLTFAKPERVPFRLTHNMVAAMGIYGYEGPFRKSCELTLSILRQQEETLMTILEAFIYDPTLDLQKEKRAHRRGDVGVKLQPQSVVDSIKRKVRGLLPTESIPLGVEELSPNNRATCKDTECKKNGDKVIKGTLRFGTYVVIQEHGGWTWKHWGCVSGQQLENVRELCQQGDGSFDCDLIDGYDELVDHPDVQEKVRRCINQGFIDPEDFKGDPEKNKLGEKGIHLTAAQKKKKEAAEAAATDDGEKPKAKGKRGRKKAGDDEEDEDEPQPKKARTSKAAKADEEEKPAAKPARGRKAAKFKDESENETAASAPAPAPAPTKRGRRTSAQKPKEESDAEEKPVPVKKGRKAATKKVKNESDDEVPAPAPAPSKRGRRTSTQKPKEESDAEEKPVPVRKGRKAATKKAAAPEEEDAVVEEEEQEKAAPRTRARRGRSSKA
ncbi:uvsb pi-3 kinase [Fusarium pseudocircinatum]|uniref:Serine/threonine-protein kinase MEC1 n=1 Tax=Fusarium pseudocircinatum TaxID=56676 RepID=A0A8H5Q095_9HYPO|nr:uvsb pi-3 kinase [Fusarium pseudocircinatum]